MNRMNSSIRSESSNLTWYSSLLSVKKPFTVSYRNIVFCYATLLILAEFDEILRNKLLSRSYSARK